MAQAAYNSKTLVGETEGQTKSSVYCTLWPTRHTGYSPDQAYLLIRQESPQEATISVKVADKMTGKETTAKYALIKGDQISLYTGIMSDKKGGWRGCGKRLLFSTNEVTVTADEPAKELKQRS